MPLLEISLIFVVLELSQGCYGLFEISSMPCGHRVGTHYVRTDPPIVAIHSNFIWSDVVRVVFVRQFVHLTTYFFIAANVNHVLAELLITDEPVVNTQEMSLLAFLLEPIRGEVLVISRLLPVTGPVGSPFLDVVVGNREEIESVLDEFLGLLRSISQEVPARAVDDADVPVRQTYFALCFGFHIE